MLRRFHRLSDEAGLPRIRAHDLRHFAAPTMLSANVPLPMAGKTLRHSAVSVTTEIYTHPLKPAARDAVDAIANALAAADAA